MTTTGTAGGLQTATVTATAAGSPNASHSPHYQRACASTGESAEPTQVSAVADDRRSDASDVDTDRRGDLIDAHQPASPLVVDDHAHLPAQEQQLTLATTPMSMTAPLSPHRPAQL
jgi:hypothetical protein